MNTRKLLPSPGRGMKLPPICDIMLPKAYYDELSSQRQMQSGIGRGRHLQEVVDGSRDSERPGETVFTPNTEPQLSSIEVPASLEDEFPKLESGNAENEVTADHGFAVSQPEVSKMCLKSLAAQFTTVK